MADHQLSFRAIAEAQPGPAWRAHLERAWPDYESWYLRDGDAARPSFVEARASLQAHMPELVPIWERLVELAGGGDLAARLLTLYDPPALMRGCSQAALGGPSPALVRNYDFHPGECEALIWHSALTGRHVIGMSDGLWGLLDGINDAGLAVSLAFGGGRAVAPGFAIPLVLRYLLETCATTAEAIAALARIPVQMTYNLTIVDASGETRTVFVGPGQAPRARLLAATTNHQDEVLWPEHARAVRSVERQRCLLALLADPAVDAATLVDAFLAPPLYSTAYQGWFGTLYTAAYRPASGAVEYAWPGERWAQSFASFSEGERTIAFSDGTTVGRGDLVALAGT